MLEERVKNFPLLDLVKQSNVSVRLANSVEWAQKKGWMPFQTVGEYVEAGDSAPGRLMALENVGVRSAQTLDVLVKNFVKNSDEYFDTWSGSTAEQSAEEQQESTEDATEREIMLEERVKNFPLLDLIKRSNTSVRFTSGLEWAQKQGWMPFQTVGEYVDAGDSALKRLMTLANVGPKKVRAFDALVKSFINDPDGYFNAWNKDITKQNAEDKQRFIKGVTLKNLLHKSFEILTDRERRIIIGRYGIDSGHCRTLEDLGRQHDVTRERIRQIETKAIRKLKHSEYQSLIASFIEKNEQSIYKKLARGRQVVLHEQLTKREAALSNECRFALLLIYGSVKEWLNNVAKVTSLGWYMLPYESEDVSSWERMVREYCEKISLPCPMVNLIEPLRLTSEEISIALELMKDFDSFSGYIIRGSATPRKKRCIQAHLLMNRLFGWEPVEIERILHHYHANYPSDLCTVRDLNIVFSEAPHLFVNLNESGWGVLGASCPTKPYEVSDCAEAEDSILSSRKGEDIAEKEEKETVFKVIYQMMENKGPMALMEAKESFTKIAGNKYSSNSVFPILLSNPDFIRMAPGVFGTKNQLNTMDPVRTVFPFLLRGSQCKIYTLARAAGSPRIEYPLWTPAMEHAWCKWGDKQKDRVLFQSLLSMVDPKSWPVPNAESDWWLRRKEKEGHYQLRTAPLNLCKKIPDPNDIYAVLFYVRARGEINWMVANRLVGCRIDDRHIVSTLSLLVAMKALYPIGGWQDRHSAGENINGVLMSMEEVRMAGGFIGWEDLPISDIDIEVNCNETWVKSDELRDLLERIESRTENMPVLTRKPNQENLDELLKRHRQHRIEEQLRSYINAQDDCE